MQLECFCFWPKLQKLPSNFWPFVKFLLFLPLAAQQTKPSIALLPMRCEQHAAGSREQEGEGTWLRRSLLLETALPPINVMPASVMSV